MLNGLNICMYAVLLYTLDFKTLMPKKHEVGSLESTREAYELLEAQSDVFPYFSLKNTNFYWKIFYLHLESSSASRK